MPSLNSPVCFDLVGVEVTPSSAFDRTKLALERSAGALCQVVRHPTVTTRLLEAEGAEEPPVPVHHPNVPPKDALGQEGQGSFVELEQTNKKVEWGVEDASL